MPTRAGLPVKQFTSAAQWERWLEGHHATADGVWLKFAKKDAGARSLPRDAALDVALCYGWIDGQAASLDERFWLQRFTRRRPRSRWSKINCAKASALIEHGRMTAAGLAEVEAAQADGRWAAAYDSPRTIAVPDDLQAELARHPRARAFFATLDSRNRYAVLYRLQGAKKPQTRARRLATFVAMLNDGKKIHTDPPTAAARMRRSRPRSPADGA